MFDGNLYTQTDGVMMGSPLGPTFANFFLANLENGLLSQEHTPSYPRLFLRYVDDIFAVFSAGVDTSDFLHILNSLHPNIKFTVEIGLNKLPFLDAEVTIEDGNFETWVYRKPTNTNVLLNAFAFCPSEWKRGLVYCFLNRAWTICSSREIFNQEVIKLKDIFVKNGYTLAFFDKILSVFISKKEQPSC